MSTLPHTFSYQYPHQFGSTLTSTSLSSSNITPNAQNDGLTELVQFLYRDQGLCPSVLTGIYAANQVDLLVELVCLVLSRQEKNINTTIHSSTLPVGTTYGEEQFIQSLGINLGRIPVTPSYFGPLVALTGDPTAFTEIQHIRPEMIDFFRILRSSTTWSATTFRDAIQNSELNHYRTYLTRTHSQTHSYAEQQIMLSTKAYELAFYRPFLSSSSDLRQTDPGTTTTHPTTPTTTTTTTHSSITTVYNFDSLPTIELIKQNQCLDVCTAVNEFLQWAGLNSITQPYSHQLSLFLGVDIILSWKHAISNIIYLLKHSYLTLDINFILWVYQIFFPSHLYTQIPQSVASTTIKTLAPALPPPPPPPPPTTTTTTTAPGSEQSTKAAAAAAFLTTDTTKSKQQAQQELPNHQFLLATRSIIIGAFITHVPDVSLEQYYYTQRLREVAADTHLFDLVHKASEQFLPPQLMRVGDDDNDDAASVATMAAGGDGQGDDKNKDPLQLGTGDLGNISPSPTSQQTSPTVSRNVDLISSSTTNPRLLVDSHSESDIGDTYDGDHSDDSDYDPESSAMSSAYDDDEEREFKLVGRLHRLRTKQAQKRNNRFSRHQQQQHQRSKQQHPPQSPTALSNDIQRHKISHQPHSNKPTTSPSTNSSQSRLVTFYTNKLSQSLAVHDILFHMFQFTFTLPIHLITLAFCSSLYGTTSTQAALSNYGLRPIVSRGFDSKLDSVTIYSILGFSSAEHQSNLKRILEQQQQLSHLNDKAQQFIINPTFPPRVHSQQNYISTTATTVITLPSLQTATPYEIPTNLCFAFATQSAFLYRQHFNLPTLNVIESVLRLVLSRGLDQIVTIFAQLQTNIQTGAMKVPIPAPTSASPTPATANSATTFTPEHFANHPTPICLVYPALLPSSQQQAQQQQPDSQTASPLQDTILSSLLPTLPPPNPTYPLLEMVTATNRCQLRSLDNFLIKSNPLFSIDSVLHHFHSNIILAIVTSPYLTPAKRAVFFNYFITLTTHHYKSPPRISIDVFMMILHSVWAAREISPPPYPIIHYIFLHLLDQQTWAKRFAIAQSTQSNPNASATSTKMVINNIISTFKALFGVELETPTRYRVITKRNSAQATAERELMTTIYQYIFPPTQFHPQTDRNSQYHPGRQSPQPPHFFSNPEIIQTKALRDVLLSPIFIIGSHTTLLYLIGLGYRLDPYDFTKLLGHTSRQTDFRDCVNVYSIMRAFYLHLYIVHARSNAVNTIEMDQIDVIEQQTFSMEQTIQRNRAGFEKFIGERLPSHLFDRKLLGTGFELAETSFQHIIEMATQGKSFMDNTPLAEENDFLEVFGHIQQAYDYHPSNPSHFQYLICDIAKQAQMTGERLHKISHYAQKSEQRKQNGGNAAVDESSSEEEGEEEPQQADDEDEDYDEDDSDYSDDDEDEDDSEYEERRLNRRRNKLAKAKSAKLETKSKGNKKVGGSKSKTSKLRQRDLFIIDPLIFDALAHYQSYICPDPESKSTLIEFILTFHRTMENFISHFIGSLLFYRATYSLQSPVMYSIMRCLIPRLDLYPAQLSHLLVDKFQGFNIMQHFNYQSLVDSFMEDVLCSTLGLRPTELEYLLTPPSIAVQLYSQQQAKRKEEEKQHQQMAGVELLGDDALQNNTDFQPEQPKLDSFYAGSQLERLLQHNKQTLPGQTHTALPADDYDLVTMTHDEREAFRLQISRLVQAIVMCIVMQHREKHPQVAGDRADAPLTHPQHCFDSFKLFYHFLKYIPLPSVTLYPDRVQSFNYRSDNGEVLETLGPSRPGIQPQFLYFIMQNVPMTAQSHAAFFSDLFNLYIQHNGPVFNKAFHHYGIIPPHLFAPTTFSLNYYHNITKTLTHYGIPIVTMIDTLWQTLPIQALQHSQFPIQNEIELVQFLWNYISTQQIEVDRYGDDYNLARKQIITDQLKEKADGLVKKGDRSRQARLRSLLELNWPVKSLKQIQHFSQTTDITGSNMVFWLSGMALPPRTCLAVIYVMDHLLYTRHNDGDDGHGKEMASSQSPLSLLLLNNQQSNSVSSTTTTSSIDGNHTRLAHNLVQVLSTTPHALSQATLTLTPLQHIPVVPSSPTQPTELVVNPVTNSEGEPLPDQQFVGRGNASIHYDVYQENGPNLQDVAPPLPDYPQLRFAVSQTQTQTVNIVKKRAVGDQDTTTAQTPVLPRQEQPAPKIPLAPFELLFQKDHSGKTFLHHLVESTEITPSRLELFACAAADPFEHRNFSSIYSTISNQAVPFVGPVPSEIAPLLNQQREMLQQQIDHLPKNKSEIGNGGGTPEQQQQQPQDETNYTSLAAVCHAFTTMKDTEPQLPLIYALNEAIGASTPEQVKHYTNPYYNDHDAVPTRTKRSSSKSAPLSLPASSSSSAAASPSLQQHSQSQQPPHQSHPSNNDTQLFEFLTQFNSIGTRQLIDCTTPHPTLSQIKHLIYNTPSTILPHNLSPELNQHRLGLLHKTIYATDNPMVFWLSYLNYYCHIAHHPQAPQQLLAMQTKNTRAHFLSYRRAVMLRQLRHRFPISLEPVSQEELQDVLRYFAHSRKGRGPNEHGDNYHNNDLPFNFDLRPGGKFKSFNRGGGQKGHGGGGGGGGGGPKYAAGHKGGPKKGKGGSTFEEREERRRLVRQNKQKRAMIGLGATAIGLAVAVLSYFWISSSAHQDDEHVEPTGEITTYSYTRDHDRMMRDNKSKRRR